MIPFKIVKNVLFNLITVNLLEYLIIVFFLIGAAITYFFITTVAIFVVSGGVAGVVYALIINEIYKRA